jgi:DNA-binding transcriptional MerR regulator
MLNDTDKYYTPKDLSEMLGIESVTLRKYSIALEKAGYIFLRNDNDRRLYSERDVMALQQLKALRERNALNVENAAMAVATKHRKPNETSETITHNEKTPVISDTNRYDERYSALEGKIDAQAEQIAQLIQFVGELATHNKNLSNIITAEKALASASELTIEKRIQEGITEALEQHGVRMKDEIERRDSEVIAFMREKLATKQELAAAEEERRKPWIKRIFGGK